ncbi:MAG: hypothetical protein RM347_005440 [Nostoc sp. ChiQUE02]|uniref:hypothetical protein n=1 Tax=Nostoc sp. ChiQUE02 TaxID=3075377 RepID=UPI002AD1F86D|nr:hypothetical protein [Nostoc sp. ChiQUE02]MDZ8231178.1 hypothetical protein [Nostoc sp. ChiQUE02]
MKKIPMLTSFDYFDYFDFARHKSAQVAQLSTTQLVERSRSVSQRSRNQRLW